MVKILLKLVLIAIIAIGGASYLVYLKTGQPLLRFDGMELPKMHTLPSLPSADQIKQQFSDVEIVADEDQKMYRWQDAQGVVHYSAEKPQEIAGKSREMNIPADTNVIPADE